MIRTRMAVERFMGVVLVGLSVVVGATSQAGARQHHAAASDTLSAGDWAAVRALLPPAQQVYFKASQVSVDDNFGYSVAVAGDTVVVGAILEDSSTPGVHNSATPTIDESAQDAGAAYVFVRSGTTWRQQAYLKASQVSAQDQFGWSVAVAGDTIVVGALQEDSSTSGVHNSATPTIDESAQDAGAAYVFVRSGTTWSQQAYLKASQVSPIDRFGHSVAVAGDTIVVGASYEDSSTPGVHNSATPIVDESTQDAGAAYVFVRSGTTWRQQTYLKASQVSPIDRFGGSVAVAGDTVVVGAVGDASSTPGVQNSATPIVDETAIRAGATYVFVRSGTTWSQQAYLKASQVSVDDTFGSSVAVAGDTVVVGAREEDSSTSGVHNSATPTVDERALDAGAAYVFVRSGTTWSQQAYLKASQVSGGEPPFEQGDLFGSSVAVTGDTIVVGALQEDSSTPGVHNSATPTVNESAENAGAAYVFVRSGTTWSQQAYLKASQVSVRDGFGGSVAVAGDTIVVGAMYEDSNTSGVQNSATPAVNESANGAGAAYGYAAPSPATPIYLPIIVR